MMTDTSATDITPTNDDKKVSFSFEVSPPLIESDHYNSSGSSVENIDQTTPDTRFFKFFPKVAPLPWKTFLSLTLASSIPALAYILCFTKMGFGLEVYDYLSDNWEPYSNHLVVFLGSFAFLLYLFDSHHWNSQLGIAARRVSIFILVTGLAFLVLCLSGVYSYGPISLFIIMTPAWMVLIRKMFYSEIPMKTYVSWLSGPFATVASIILVSWIIWTSVDADNTWNLYTSLAAADDSGCDPDFTLYPNCRKNENDDQVCFEVNAQEKKFQFDDNCSESCYHVYDSCLNTFIIWVGPFLVATGLLFLSFFATFLRGDASPEKDATRFARIWMFLLFAMWVSASLAGAAAGVSTALAALTAAGFIASAIFLANSYSRLERESKLKILWVNIMEKYGSWLDCIKGLLIVTCTPVAFIYVAISFLIQQLRNIACYNRPGNDTASLRHIGGVGWVTIEARRLIREVKSWDRAKVFTYAIYWGIAFMILNVIVSQFVILLLSYVIEQTSQMTLLSVTLILCAVGITLFLLPPVPGAPIYLVLGICIIPAGREKLGIFGCGCYCVIVSLFLKLTACALQQKMIGELLSHKVSIRQFVGINSNLIRSMRLVLSEPGLSIAKVSILVGGPDWPTSVLCGIMRLPLIPILIGTLPIIFLIVPTMLTGFFAYMANLQVDGELEFPWADTATTIAAAMTGIVQFGSMVVAAFYLEQTVSNRADELQSIPIDEEVKAADEEQEEFNKAHEEVTKWKDMPSWVKLILSSSLALMIVTCYMVQLFLSECFTEYQMTYTISANLDGDWTNLVKPLGKLAMSLFLLSVGLYYCYSFWVKARTAERVSGKSKVSSAIYPEENTPQTDYNILQTPEENTPQTDINNNMLAASTSIPV